MSSARACSSLPLSPKCKNRVTTRSSSSASACCRAYPLLQALHRCDQGGEHWQGHRVLKAALEHTVTLALS